MFVDDETKDNNKKVSFPDLFLFYYFDIDQSSYMMDHHLMVVDFHKSGYSVNVKILSYKNDFENKNMIFDILIDYHHKSDRQINKSLVIKLVDIHWIGV
jgi:hypothetical protein